jgi:hypothetical protein
MGFDPKATLEAHRNCPLLFLQQSFREQREPVFMTLSRHSMPLIGGADPR